MDYKIPLAILAGSLLDIFMWFIAFFGCSLANKKYQLFYVFVVMFFINEALYFALLEIYTFPHTSLWKVISYPIIIGCCQLIVLWKRKHPMIATKPD